MNDLNEKINELEKKIESMVEKEKSFHKKLNRFLKYSFSIFFVFGSLLAFAQITSLHIFNDGEIISAQKINENFSYLDNKISTISSGGTITQSISSFTDLSLSSLDNGTMFVVSEDVLRIHLPAIADVGAGYNLKFSMKSKVSQIQLFHQGDVFDSNSSNYDLMIIELTNNSGYLELLSTGDSWFVSLNSGLSTSVYESSNYSDYSCSSDGASSTNCYNNTAAINGVYAVIDNRYMFYSGGYWYSALSNYYLINDSHSMIDEFFTSRWGLASASMFVDNGTLYAVMSSTQSPYDLLMYDSDYYNPTETNNDDFINEKVALMMAGGQNTGSSCQVSLGVDWRHIRASESTAAIASSVNNNFWTASTSSSLGDFIYIDKFNTSYVSNDEYQYHKVVCVYDPT